MRSPTLNVKSRLSRLNKNVLRESRLQFDSLKGSGPPQTTWWYNALTAHLVPVSRSRVTRVVCRPFIRVATNGSYRVAHNPL